MTTPWWVTVRRTLRDPGGDEIGCLEIRVDGNKIEKPGRRLTGTEFERRVIDLVREELS